MEAPFYDHVYEVVRAVPRGNVTTYGAIAKYLGTGLSARMVGWAMNKSGGVKPSVPAHRVVNRIGLLTGKHFFQSESMMQQLLENEGLMVKDDQIINFPKVFWDPARELPINLQE